MPDADNRKRSRSPEQQQSNKRLNKGPNVAPVPISTTVDSQKTIPTDHQSPNESDGLATDGMTPTKLPTKVQQDSSASADAKEGIKKESEAPEGFAAQTANSPTPAAMIHMRCLIVTQDASIIIGKGGSHVNEIRDKSGARVMVSESIPGNPERILNVSGPLDAVSKVDWFLCLPRFMR